MSRLFLLNGVLALSWVAVTASFTTLNFLFGFVLGSFALWLVRDNIGAGSYFGRARRLCSLALLFLKELVLSAVRVAKLSLRRDMSTLRPGFIAYQLTVDRDAEITLLANLITLTPGTLSVDVSDDRKTLYIHAIDVDNIEALRDDIANGFERKIMEAMR